MFTSRPLPAAADRTTRTAAQTARRRRARVHPSARRRLLLEPLESRRLLANTVTLHDWFDGVSPDDRVIFLSTNRGGTVASSDGSQVQFAPADILRLAVDPDQQFRYDKVFDGGDVGLRGRSRNIDGFDILPDGTLVLSLTRLALIPWPGGAIRAAGADLLQFTPTSLGEDTAGEWSTYLDGSDVGLNALVEVDGVDVQPDGSILLSLGNAPRFFRPRIGFDVEDQDVVRFTPELLGDDSRGAWSPVLAGRDVGLTARREGVDGVSQTADGLFLSTHHRFRVPGLTGDGADVFQCDAVPCTQELDGSLFGLARFGIDGFAMVDRPAAEPPPVFRVQTIAGLRPMDFEVIRTINPTLHVDLPNAVCIPGSRIVLHDVDPSTEEEDITSLLFPGGVSPTCTGSAEINAAFGENIVVLTLPDGSEFARAQMFNYTDETIAIGSSADPDDITTDPDSGVQFHTSQLLVDFKDGTQDIPISNFLRAHRLRTIGEISRENADNKLLIVDTSESPLGTNPREIAEAILVLDSPIVDTAIPDLVVTPERVVGERLPSRLVNGDAPNGGEGYDATRGGFENDGDSDLNTLICVASPITGLAGPPVRRRALCDELDLASEHFYTDLFAAHRLRDHLVPAGTRTPLLAVMGSGFGTGGATAATNRALLDVPLSRLGPRDATGAKLTSADGSVDFEGVDTMLAGRLHVHDPAGPFNDADFRASAIDITNLHDNAGARAHETGVIVRAAGNGSGLLGPGKDVNVLPIRISGDGLAHEYTALRLAAHSAVDVINRSRGVTPRNLDLPPDQGMIALLARQGVTAQKFLNLVSDKILVNSSGNRPNLSPDADFLFKLFAPPRDAGRSDTAPAPNYPRFMNVSSTELMHEVNGPEAGSFFASTGSLVSVSAPGGNVPVRRRNGDFSIDSGTSLAAPVVAGLAAELIQVDEAVHGAPAAGDLPQRRLRIVEFVEATADDLGTSQGVAPFVSNNPDDGPDNRFGHGRVNTWKATLSVVNGGISSEGRTGSGGRDSRFRSLDLINADQTAWYGFKIRTSVLGATVWIDGTQLRDAAATVPNAPSITAYKGVAPEIAFAGGNLVLDQGAVAVGNNGGEYVVTFSIEKSDLVGSDAEGNPVLRNLILRRPDTGEVFFDLKLELEKMRQNLVPGVSFDDFVFEITPADFGDASDTGDGSVVDHPTLLRRAGDGTISRDGARHLNSNLEWFGALDAPNVESVSPETNAGAFETEQTASGDTDPDGMPNLLGPQIGNRIHLIGADLDRFDDGIVFYPLTYEPSGTGRVDFSICVADATSSRYAVDPLYVNAWFDWDTLDSWEDNSDEHVIDSVQIAPGFWPADPAPGITRQEVSPTRNCARYRAEFPVPASIGGGELWARFRLDYGENVDRPFGAARFGEVEDYRIGSDFGTAPDPFMALPPGQYPSLKDNAGARHLDITREWLGPTVSHEIDAFDGDNDGVVVPPVVEPGAEITIEVNVSSTVNARGYNHRSIEIPVASWDFSDEDQACDAPSLRLYALPTTPLSSAGKGRYDGAVPQQRLYVNGWADWNANGIWEEGEKVLDGIPVAPETFGPDGQYTLGEPFGDVNGNGVFTPSVDLFDPNLHDAAGVPSRTFKCKLTVPAGVQPAFWWRFRLSYGENGATDDAVVHHAAEQARALANEKGGALFGEVEDYRSTRLTILVPQKTASPTVVSPGTTTHFVIELPNPTQSEASGQIIDSVPPALIVDAATVSCTPNANSCQFQNGDVVAAGPVAPGESLIVQFDASVLPSSPTAPPLPPQIENCALTVLDNDQQTVCTIIIVPTTPGGGAFAPALVASAGSGLPASHSLTNGESFHPWLVPSKPFRWDLLVDTALADAFPVSEDDNALNRSAARSSVPRTSDRLDRKPSERIYQFAPGAARSVASRTEGGLTKEAATDLALADWEFDFLPASRLELSLGRRLSTESAY